MSSERPHVVIGGGGVAALEALLALRATCGDRVAITLVAPGPEFVYRPLATGDPFVVTKVKRYPLEAIARDHGARLVGDSVAEVDGPARAVVTGAGERLHYDHLVLGLGARPYPAIEHALTFRGPDDVEAFHGVVQDVEGGYLKRIAFVIPSVIGWPLPMYELALMTAERARSVWVEDTELLLITPEQRPLELFGHDASEAVAGLLRENRVTILTGTHVARSDRGALSLMPGERTVTPERIVASPMLAGPALPGVPTDDQGFIVVDDHSCADRAAQVYAAGDGTAFPLKQGGVAAQQADAAAYAIAGEIGAISDPAPFRPVLRGMLLTGTTPRYFRADLTTGEGPAVSERPLWWPPDKIAGRYLAPYLGAPAPDQPPGAPPRELLPVERPLPPELDTSTVPDAYRRFGHFGEPEQ